MVAAEGPSTPRPPLSRRQREVLAFISERIDVHGYPPTIREIGRHFGINSTNGVSDHLKALTRKGYLTHQEGKSRTLRPVDAPQRPRKAAPQAKKAGVTSVPMLGRIAAGQPILAPEEARTDENLWVDSAWVGTHREVYALQVTGQSMIEDGILDGDTVFVKRTETATSGETVVVGIDNEVTLKRYFPEKNRVRLQPANAAMQPIYLYPQEGKTARIMGVVIGVYRRI